jgi:hypothetical protein
MKTRMASLLSASVLLLVQLNLLANGIVNFNSTGAPPDRRIYRGDGLDPVFWQPCGPEYKAALYWGPADVTDDAQLTQIGASVNFLGGIAEGTFFGGNRIITTPAAGPVLSFQVRAWLGPSETYEGVINYYHFIAGKGPIFQVDTKDPDNSLETIPNIWRAPGFRGFVFGPDGVTSIIVPEPSTIALAVLGLGALFLLRLRRRT